MWSRLPLVNDIARRILAWQGQLVIDQDLEALEEQNRVIQKYGEDFNNTSADAIHVMVESIRDALAEGNDPRTLPVKTAEVSFWVMNTIALIVVFWLLVLWVVVDPERRKLVLGKTRGEWFMDGIGLLVQGTVIPLLQIGLVATMLNALVPAWQGTWHLAPVAAFLLAFVGVDYLFYWNHRMLHTELLWKTHMVHHSVTHMDVMATSRNTVWTSLLIVYLWAHGTFLFLLAEPGAYAVGVAMTAALDMWRHSATGPRPGGRTHRVLGLVFILPGDHAWHHARGGRGNYGANLSVWDRLHGTYVRVKTNAPRAGRSGGHAAVAQASVAASMTLLGTLMLVYPALIVAAALGALGWLVTSPGWLPALVLPAIVYLVPLLTFRLHELVYPVKPGARSIVGADRYESWYGAHQIQLLFIGIPQLEALLRLVPGLYSAWLRAWGSTIGKNVYWTPLVDIADRNLMEVGDQVIWGHRSGAFAHVITPRKGTLVLYVKRVRIESGAFVGAGANFGPGATVEAGATVKALEVIGPNQVVRAP